MSDKPANPRAFPWASSNSQNGMTLRDYFAAAALTGIVSRTTCTLADMCNSEPSAMTASFEIADAMLRARDEGENHD